MATTTKICLNAVIMMMMMMTMMILAVVDATTIISIKYPSREVERPQLAKRDLSLSYAATNIDNKEGTRVKTITVIKNIGGVSSQQQQQQQQQQQPHHHQQYKPTTKLVINPELHRNEEWANAFRDNFDKFGVLPEVPDIDELFEFVNRKSKPEKSEKSDIPIIKKKEEKSPSSSAASPPAPPSSPVAPVAEAKKLNGMGDNDDNVAAAAPVEKIKGDAELLPHTKEANILRLQSFIVSNNAGASATGVGGGGKDNGYGNDNSDVAQAIVVAGRQLRTRESLINVNYSTPMHAVTQYYDNYVQQPQQQPISASVGGGGYDYQKPCAYPNSPPNSIQVTTPSGRTYDIPRNNNNNNNIDNSNNNPYIAPSIVKKTQVVAQSPPSQQPPSNVPLPPNFNTVNSLVPPIQQPQQQPAIAVQQPQAQQPQPQQPGLNNVGGNLGGGGGGISTSQRPYVAPSLRNNGLGINRGPGATIIPSFSSTTQSPAYGNLPSYRIGGGGGGNAGGGGFGNRPNSFRSRGLKY